MHILFIFFGMFTFWHFGSRDSGPKKLKYFFSTFFEDRRYLFRSNMIMQNLLLLTHGGRDGPYMGTHFSNYFIGTNLPARAGVNLKRRKYKYLGKSRLRVRTGRTPRGAHRKLYPICSRRVRLSSTYYLFLCRRWFIGKYTLFQF